MEQIHVIIPAFSGWRETRKCLEALGESTYREVEIVVVDHGPADEAKENLFARHPEVVRVRGEESLWWAGATNLGIREAMRRGAKSIMLLNHDCYVEPETIRRLAEHARRAGEAIIAPVQVDFCTREVIGASATTLFLFGFPTVVLPVKRRHLGQTRLLPTKLILGGRGALIPTSLFERFGLFDEKNLPSYYSDHDFYLRCRRRGVPLFVAADAIVYIDNTRTTLAAKAGELDLGGFLRTLIVPRSHRNIRDLTALFRLHYPIPGLHHIGVALNLLRYFVLYGCKRAKRGLADSLGIVFRRPFW